jgi:hypothetical protein
MDLHAVIEKNGAETMIALIRILSCGRLAILYQKLAVIRSCGGSLASSTSVQPATQTNRSSAIGATDTSPVGMAASLILIKYVNQE